MTSFEKIGNSDQRLYGERKLLLCGFSPTAQSKFKTLLEMLDIKKLPLVWASNTDGDTQVGKLMQKADGSGEGVESQLPRTLIVAGVEENELHQLISGCRQAGMKQALWATLTPTSEGWPLTKLINELSAERKAISKAKNRR